LSGAGAGEAYATIWANAIHASGSNSLRICQVYPARGLAGTAALSDARKAYAGELCDVIAQEEENGDAALQPVR
jgi:hypothetical protein